MRAGKLTLRDAWERTFKTNVTNTHFITEAFARLILKSKEGRIIFISSSVGSMDEQLTMKSYGINQSPKAGWPKEDPAGIMTYRSSKAAVNMLALEWKRLLREDGVHVAIINPGLLATNLGYVGAEKLKQMGAADPIVGGMVVRATVEGDRDADEDKMIQKDGTAAW